MQNGHGPLIDYLVGTAVRGMGLIQMQRWVGKTHLTPDQLKDYIRQLGLNPDEEGTAFANTIKAEYQFQIGYLDAMRQGKMTNSDSGGYSLRQCGGCRCLISARRRRCLPKKTSGWCRRHRIISTRRNYRIWIQADPEWLH